MLVCWKHRTINVVGCRECRANALRKIVAEGAKETARKIDAIFRANTGSPDA